MTTYPKYKPSGIEWIGDIPEHWVVRKLKYIGENIIGITYSPEDVRIDGNGILVLRSSNIQNGLLTFEDNVYVNKEIKDKQLTKAGDILICARNGSSQLIGKCAKISEDYSNLTFGAFMSIFRSNIGDYAHYFFNSQIFKSQLGLFSTSTINQLTSHTLNNLFVPLPSLPEQSAIANFLDQKTALIDSFVEKKKKLIELLKEERTAIINRAVTKGINPNVKLKPSGIEWLGDIPEHWEVKKLKYIANLRDEIIEDSKFTIAVENIESGTGKLVNMDDDKTFQGSISRFVKGDTIFNKLRPYLHKVYFAINDGGIYGELLILYSKGELIPKYLFYILFSKSFIDLVNSSTQGTKMPRANWNDIISQIALCFSNDKLEQNLIVEFIETETQKIDIAITKIEKEIELMQEYRTALISEVVTGKVRVI